jgi:uncharacterized protein with NRDE domain
MCLIAWNWQPHSELPLLLVANRDEFYARPTLPLHRWKDAQIFAGQDLQAGGTWLGLGPGGRLAALTNVRNLGNQRDSAPSRGALVSGFLHSDLSGNAYLQSIMPDCDRFNPFNLLVFDGQSLLGFESQGGRMVEMQAGISAVSNAGFDTPWPKLVALKSGLQKLAQGYLPNALHPQLMYEPLFGLLADARAVPDELLPNTGIPIERERALSSAFIRSADYGTRASSVVVVRRNSAEFIERSFDAQGFTGETRVNV